MLCISHAEVAEKETGSLKLPSAQCLGDHLTCYKLDLSVQAGLIGTEAAKLRMVGDLSKY